MINGVGDVIHFERIKAVTTPEELIALKDEIKDVYVDESIKAYIVEIVHRTRESKSLKTGASPRASRYLYQGGKTLAAIRGRDYVTPNDIQDLLIPVLSHRIQLAGEARYSGMTPEKVIMDIMKEVEVPPVKEKVFD